MELDLFGQVYSSQPWWKDYLTGGSKGPGGENFDRAQALRERFERSGEAAENGWGPFYRDKRPVITKVPRSFYRKGA